MKEDIETAWRYFEPCLENVRDTVWQQPYQRVDHGHSQEEEIIHATWATERMLEVKGLSLPKETK